LFKYVKVQRNRTWARLFSDVFEAVVSGNQRDPKKGCTIR